MSLNLNVSAHMGELAASLGDLQRQFRQAARVEVARAIGDAIRQFAVTAIGGVGSSSRTVDDDWHDRWRAPDASWPDDEDFDSARPGNASSGSVDLTRLHAAVLLGIGGARWTFARTRHPAAALAVGLLLVLVGIAGGRTADAILEAWSAAHDLLRTDSLRSGA
jgi:hypothetical protein